MDWDAFYDESCFTVCLYGVALDKADIVPLVGEIDELLRSTGQATTHLSVQGRGFGRMPLLFDRAFKRLQRADPRELERVTLFVFIDDWRTQGDWIATSKVNTERSYFLLGTGLSTMADAEARIMDLVGRWLGRLGPAYGIGYYRPRGRGPSGYCIGLPVRRDLVFEGPEYEEDRAVQRWGDGMREAVWEQGVLRDVYPYSLLTARHLEREAVSGMSLGAWIRAADWRGQLSEACAGGYTLWTVAGENLARVRRALACAGALYVLPRDNHLGQDQDVDLG